MTTKELFESVKKHDRLYYSDSAPLISDAEYDELRDTLITTYQNETNKDLRAEIQSYIKGAGHTPLNTAETVRHSSIMGSLDKVNNLSDFSKWRNKYNSELIATPKIDGCAISLIYVDGKLTLAATRGDGEVGQNITANARVIDDIPNKIEGFSGEVRGEVYMKNSVFNNLNASGMSFANPRNAASGSLGLQDPKKVKDRYLSFFAYDLITAKTFKTEAEKLDHLKSLGIPVVNYLNVSDVESYIASMEHVRPSLDFDIDGLVFSLNDLEEQEDAGWHGKRPMGKMAYKFKPDQAKTVVKDIEVSVGRTGCLTCIALIDPVQLNGSTVRRVAIGSYNGIKTLGVNIGDEILVEKAGEIIPQALRITDKRTDGIFTFPELCPSCGGNTENDGMTIWCMNDTCSAKLEGRVNHFLKTLDVKGFGPSVISSLCSSGLVNTLVDLYSLSVSDIVGIGIGEKTAKNLLSELESKKDIPVEVFLDSLGISGLGTTSSKLLVKKYHKLEVIRNLSYDEIVNMDGFGGIIAENITSGFASNDSLIDGLLSSLNVIDFEVKQGNLTGKSFCLTGKLSKPRKEIEKWIEDNGGEIKSVGKGLSYLVQADASSTSSKTQKAHKYGVEIIDEKMLMEMVNE